jgi:hypothetical protein
VNGDGLSLDELINQTFAKSTEATLLPVPASPSTTTGSRTDLQDVN